MRLVPTPIVGVDSTNPSDFGQEQGRAKQPTTSAEQAADCNSAKCRFSRAEQEPENGDDLRTSESMRAADTWCPPSERPLATSRMTSAGVLYEVLRRFDVSQNRLADMLGVNEKQIRKMLDGSASVPAGVLSLLPIDMAFDFFERVMRRRGVKSRPLPAILSALDELESSNALGPGDVGTLASISARASGLIARASPK